MKTEPYNMYYKFTKVLLKLNSDLMFYFIVLLFGKTRICIAQRFLYYVGEYSYFILKIVNE